MEDPHFWPLTARKPPNRFRRNLKQMITSATRPLMPNLVIVRLAGARPRIGEIVTLPVSIFLPFFLFFYFLTFLLTCTDSIVRRRNVVNGS